MKNLAEFESQLPAGIYFKTRERKLLTRTAKYTNKVFAEALKKRPLAIGGHGVDHWNRVAYIAGNIAAIEGLPILTAVLAGFQHDVGRVIDDPRAHNKYHGQLSVETITDFFEELKEMGREEKDIIYSAIEDHPFLNSEVRDNYLIKILMDADRVDGMGAIMSVRSSSMHWHLPCYADLRSEVPIEDQGGTIFQSIKWTTEWYDMMWTKAGRALARPRVEFMRLYGEEYLKEAEFADRCARRLGF